MAKFTVVEISKITEPEHSIKVKTDGIAKQKFQEMINKFGQFQSVTIAKVGEEVKIVDGLQMFLQLKEAKEEKVCCCYLGEMSEKDYLTYRLFLNSQQNRLDYIGIAGVVNLIGANENDLISIANKTGMPIKEVKNYKDLLSFNWDDYLSVKFPTEQMNLFDEIEKIENEE